MFVVFNITLVVRAPLQQPPMLRTVETPTLILAEACDDRFRRVLKLVTENIVMELPYGEASHASS